MNVLIIFLLQGSALRCEKSHLFKSLLGKGKLRKNQLVRASFLRSLKRNLSSLCTKTTLGLVNIIQLYEQMNAQMNHSWFHTPVSLREFPRLKVNLINLLVNK